MRLKQLSNPLRIGKGLLCLLALFVMLLAPQGAWAEPVTYDLWVGDVQVTSDNAANVLSSETPTVVFDAQNKVLTLNNATITGSIVWTSQDDLTVNLVGNSSVGGFYPSSTDPIFKGNGGALLFTTSDQTPGSLEVYVTSEMSYFMSGWNTTTSTPIWHTDCGNDPLDYTWWVDQGCDYMKLGINHVYDLWLDGTQLCSANRGINHSENPNDPKSISFDGSNTLTIQNFSHTTTKSPFIKNGLSNLVIVLFGENTINCGELFLDKKDNNDSDHNVTFESYEYSPGTLVVNTAGGGIAGHNAPTFVNLAYSEDAGDNTRTLSFSTPTFYNLKVGGVSVTSANASHILGDNDQSVTYEASTNTLTLNNAMIDLTGQEQEEEYGIKYTGTENFTIKLIGTNSIKTHGGCEPIINDVTIENRPTLTFEIGSIPCSLELQTTENDPVIKYFGGLKGVNGLSDISGNLYLIDDDGVQYVENQGLYKGETTNLVAVSSATITSGYGITVAGNLVSEDNAENVLGDDDHSVTFDADHNTLKLNGATIGSATASGNINVSSYVGELTIEINGQNAINGHVSGGHQKLNIVMAEGAESPSLKVNNNNENPIFSFSEISLGDGLYLNPYKLNDNEYVALPNVYYDGLQYNDPVGNIPAQVVFSTNEPEASTPSIWIGGKEASTNGTFDGFAGASFVSNTLTLTDVMIGDAGGDFVNIVSSLPSLTINLVNADRSVNELAGRIISLNPSATLTFKGNGGLFINNTTPISGFSGTPTYEDALVYKKYEQYAEVKTLYAPFISMVGEKRVVFGSEDFGMMDADKFPGVTIKYTISYPDQEGTPAEVDYDYYSEEGVPFEGPCTITAYVAYQGKQSATSTGKYFGFKTNPVTVAEGETIDVPQIVPEYAKADGLEFTIGDCVADIATYEEGKITGVSAGRTQLEASVQTTGEVQPSYTILNQSNDGMLDPLTITVLKDPKFSFSYSENSAIADGDTISYYYGEEQTLPVLKRWENGYTTDLSDFTVTYTSSDENVATISNTGVITIVGGGWAEIRASIAATNEYAADETWFTMEVIPAVPQVSIQDGAYFTGQKLTLTRVGESGSMYYSFGYEEDKSKRTPYNGEISLPAGEYLFYPYTRCGTDENSIWSVNWPIELYVYDEPTISKDAGEYEGDIEVEITNLPQPQSNNISVKVYYYLGDDDGDEENDKLYTAGDKITVRESTKLNVYLLVEGDSNKRYKTEVIERQYVIKDIPLDVTAADFHNHWMTYYHDNNGNVGLPENQNIGAYVATSISGNEIVVTQIKSIPRGEPVLLNNETTTTTTNVFGQDVQGNLLKHATEVVQLDEECDYYGLYNGTFMRVTGTIPAGKNYLMVPNAVVPGGNAPQLTIVFDDEATGVNDVRSKKADVSGDVYDLQGRKMQKLSKKGLYIKDGHKVVVK